MLEDAAQAHGATWHGRRAGALGHAACFSFYPTKNLSACGDAGMVTTSDAEFAKRVWQVANHGAGEHRYDNVVLGTNSRLDTLQAAVLRVKLRHLERWNAERAERAALYSKLLADVPGLVVPREKDGARSAWHLYTIRVRERDALAAHLRARGIGTAIHYPRPIHLQPAMAAAMRQARLAAGLRAALARGAVPASLRGAAARGRGARRGRGAQLRRRGRLRLRPGAGAQPFGPSAARSCSSWACAALRTSRWQLSLIRCSR